MSTEADTAAGETFKGGGGSFHLMLGGSPMDGFVIGGALLSQGATDPTVEADAGELNFDKATLSFGQFALFGDWFPDPQGGFHVGLALGPSAWISEVEQGGTTTKNESTGFGGTLFLGYDFWISADWSLGALLGAFSSSTKDTVAGEDVKFSTGGLNLQITALYH